MMKVLFVAHSADLSGGANRSLLSLMKGLRPYGIQPALLVPAAGGALEKECEKERIPVFAARYPTCCTVFRREGKDALRLLKLLAAPLSGRLAARRMDRSLPRDFDLIYTNERMIAAGACLANRRNIPHIWQVRSFGAENETYYPPFYETFMRRYSQRIVLISRALYDRFAARIGPEKLVLVHNGVKIEDCEVREKAPHDGFRILLTGRLVPPKGQLEAVGALELLQAGTDRPVELFLAGDVPAYGGEKYVRQLRERIEQAGLSERVHMLGEVRDMTELRRHMDLELVCSWCEAFGRVTVEAMCAGLPVIGSDAGGTPEILVDGETGLLYRPHDAADLARKILWLVENPDRGRVMGESGRLRAAEQFREETMVEKTEAVIRQTVEEFRAKRTP